MNPENILSDDVKLDLDTWREDEPGMTYYEATRACLGEYDGGFVDMIDADWSWDDPTLYLKARAQYIERAADVSREAGEEWSAEQRLALRWEAAPTR